jgi:hypothetical protein
VGRSRMDFGLPRKYTQPAGNLCTTPGGGEGGFWQSGCGLAADRDGYVYAVFGKGARVTLARPSCNRSLRSVMRCLGSSWIDGGAVDVGSGWRMAAPSSVRWIPGWLKSQAST